MAAKTTLSSALNKDRESSEGKEAPTFAPSNNRRKRNTDPDKVLFKNVTKGQWDKLCIMVMEGVKIANATKKLGIKHHIYRAIMRDDLAAREQMLEARAEYDNGQWPEDLVEAICVDIAMGKRLIKIADERFFKVHQFHALRLRDEYVDEMFKRARQIYAEELVDELVELSDDDSNDMATDAKGGDKPNTAAVQRSRLKTENRRWLAGKLLKDVYGDNQTIEANITGNIDHSLILEQARKRKEQGTKQIEGEVVSEQ